MSYARLERGLAVLAVAATPLAVACLSGCPKAPGATAPGSAKPSRPTLVAQTPAPASGSNRGAARGGSSEPAAGGAARPAGRAQEPAKAPAGVVASVKATGPWRYQIRSWPSDAKASKPMLLVIVESGRPDTEGSGSGAFFASPEPMQGPVGRPPFGPGEYHFAAIQSSGGRCKWQITLKGASFADEHGKDLGHSATFTGGLSSPSGAPTPSRSRR